MEDKSNICQRLLLTLQATRAGMDIYDMRYYRNNETEWVRITFNNGHVKRINVEADSGIALIQDVVRALM